MHHRHFLGEPVSMLESKAAFKAGSKSWQSSGRQKNWEMNFNSFPPDEAQLSEMSSIAQFGGS
jgi:hypothetical protein